jgi:hypothetical protein
MRELKLLTGKRVIIVTEATALAGIVESATRHAVTLVTASAVDGPQPVEILGQVIVPIDRISYVQVP